MRCCFLVVSKASELMRENKKHSKQQKGLDPSHDLREGS
jgi:hypothetical protein